MASLFEWIGGQFGHVDWYYVGLVLDYLIKIVAVGLVPEGRRPSSSTAWLLAILLVPVVGLPLFLLMGSPYINRRRHDIQIQATTMIEDVHEGIPDEPGHLYTDPEIATLIRLNRRLTGLPAVVSRNLGVYYDYDETIRVMAAEIDKATSHVNVEIYIAAWDETTDVFFQALARAVQRGVKVRFLFDHVGSWKYPGYRTLRKRLDAIGVDNHLMLPLQPWNWRFRRPDLRNHRKLVIIDDQVGFIGSQNMIDRSYLVRKNRKKGLQWVDIMVQVSGPIVSSMEYVFAADWYSESDERIEVTPPSLERGVDKEGTLEPQANLVQLVPSGPGYTTEPNLRMFNSIVHHAKTRLVLCSPYFIPDESLLEAVTTAAYRGVDVELLVSEEADQFMVFHAQSSYYQTLLEAGVRIFQYPKPYVLHTKYILADPDSGPDSGPCGSERLPLAAVGSSNMDMRSFGLNYESTMLVAAGDLIADLNALTSQYLEVSTELTLEKWNTRSWGRRYIDNVMKLTSALQ